MKVKTKTISEKRSTKLRMLICFLVTATFHVYYYCNPRPQFYYDYTFRVAGNFLRGAVGFTERPPSWLNEFVPFEGFWYSVFPLGGVLTMLPFAFFKLVGMIVEMPASLIAGLIAAAVCLFLILIAERYEFAWSKRILLVAGILFGTWMWTNLAIAGAWQLALGFAMLGELGAIYFTIFNRHPLLAGLFFALAFGNRTEIILTAPIFLYLLQTLQIPADENLKQKTELEKTAYEKAKDTENEYKTFGFNYANRNLRLKIFGKFCLAPFILGVLTLFYNYIRFQSPFDFGYARIPGILSEPWYRHGIFSIYYIPQNFLAMLCAPWKLIDGFPYLVPSGFDGSILLSSPFLLFLFRFGARDKILKYAVWSAIIVLTFLLWIHGNSGGWQFSYRYAMILLPWAFLILLENSPKKITLPEWCLYAFSILINAYAAYLFFWTDYVKP